MSTSGDCDRWAGRCGQSGPVGQPHYPTHYVVEQAIEQQRQCRLQNQTTHE